MRICQPVIRHKYTKCTNLPTPNTYSNSTTTVGRTINPEHCYLQPTTSPSEPMGLSRGDCIYDGDAKCNPKIVSKMLKPTGRRNKLQNSWFYELSIIKR
jgi:hypothetical protein